MKNVLFVDCCIRGEASRTKKLADAFLSALPADCRVTRLDLMAEELSYFKDGYFTLPLRAPVCAGGPHRHRRAVLGSFLPGPAEGLHRAGLGRRHHLRLHGVGPAGPLPGLAARLPDHARRLLHRRRHGDGQPVSRCPAHLLRHRRIHLHRRRRHGRRGLRRSGLPRRRHRPGQGPGPHLLKSSADNLFLSEEVIFMLFFVGRCDRI